VAGFLRIRSALERGHEAATDITYRDGTRLTTASWT